jgi:hypothetical protein
MTSTTLPQTTRNQEIAEKVDLLLAEAEKLGVTYTLRTRRQARKMLMGRGTLRVEMLRERAFRQEAK